MNGFLRKKIDIVWIIFKSLHLSQIREAPRYHLKSDVTISFSQICQYTRPIKSVSIRDQPNLSAHATKQICQYTRPIKYVSTLDQSNTSAHSTNQICQYTRPIKSVSTRDQSNLSVYATNQICQFTRPIKSVSTSDQANLSVFVLERKWKGMPIIALVYTRRLKMGQMILFWS